MRHILVLGATGAIGKAVVQHFQNDTITATYFTQTDAAQQLQSSTCTIHRCDLTDLDDIHALCEQLQHQPPNIIIQCAAWTTPNNALAHQTHDALGKMMHINCLGPLELVRHLEPSISANGGADVVFLSALDRAQSLPIPVGFAATQGAINAMTMALAHELAPKNWRINTIACGLLNEGLSSNLDPKLREAYLTYSAFKREGTPQEVARAIGWLVTQNSYMNGKIVSLNGGI